MEKPGDLAGLLTNLEEGDANSATEEDVDFGYEPQDPDGLNSDSEPLGCNNDDDSTDCGEQAEEEEEEESKTDSVGSDLKLAPTNHEMRNQFQQYCQDHVNNAQCEQASESRPTSP